MSKKKKTLTAVIIAACVCAAALVVFVIAKGRKSATPTVEGEAYVTRIADLMGLSAGDTGLNQRYAGVVEPQETKDIQKDETKTVAELYVAVDDEVKAGDPLFRYDIDAMKLDLDSKNLELEKIENQIVTQQQQIDSLEKQAKNATGDTLLEYTIQINEAKLALKQYEYDRDAKKAEITSTQQSIDDAIVVSPIDGVIRSINEKGSQSMTGETSSAYIVIVANGDFRVKGLVNEQNVSQMTPGMAVVVRSRVNPDQTWTGSVSLVDTSNPDNSSGGSNGGIVFDSGINSSVTSSTKYPFYVTLDSTDGLMMGQHVFIELQNVPSAVPHTEGVWLYDGYFFYDEGSTQAYVYADNGRGVIEKRAITLGSYDEASLMYEVTDGLSQDDCIAFPDESVSAGMSAVKTGQ